MLITIEETPMRGQGDYDIAMSDYNKAIEINPNYVDAYNNRGNIYSQGKGEYDNAIPDYDKAIEINPTECTDIL